MQEVQARRAKVTVPGGRRLHEYADLYICGRNPMLYKWRGRHHEICVLSVSTAVLDLPGVVITDSNASSGYVRFEAAPDGLGIVNRDRTFAEYWTDGDPIEEWRKKAAKCAEVLVPDCVAPRFLGGIYVSCEQSREVVSALSTGLALKVDRHLFFL